jgi:nitrogen-specific signal transduction histidine kinase/HD-like signal output (HDOD) protein
MKDPALKPIQRIDAAQLPSLPHILLKLLEAANGDGDGGEAWPHGVGQDPALAARVLAAWRSGTPQPDSEPPSLERAMVALGAEAVQAIIRNSSVQHVFSQVSSHSITDLKYLWWRSALCGTLARLIAEQTKYPHAAEAYLGGLLSNIGQIALWTALSKDASRVNEGESGESTPQDAENAHVGDAHSRIGARLISSWNLNSFMSDAVLYHHEPVERVVDAHPLIRIVHLANGLTDHLTENTPVPSDAAHALFGLESGDLDKLVSTARSSVGGGAKSFRIALEEASSNGETPPPNERRKNRGILSSALHAQESDIDASIKLQLAREVRDLALLEGVRQLIANSARGDEIPTALAQSANVLFGLDLPLLFLDTGNGQLRGKPFPGQDARIADLVVPLHGGKSLLAQSLAKNTPFDTLSQRSNSILDEQMARLAGCEGVCYVPLPADGQTLGAAVFGIEHPQISRLGKQRKLLMRFSRIAAQAMLAARGAKSRAATTTEGELAEFRARARRIAHEVNNPLSIMKNYIKLLMMKIGESDPARNELRIVNDEIDRVSAILRGLSQPQGTPTRARVDINALISDLVEFSRSTLFAAAGITLTTRLAETIPPLATDPDKVKQILLNLLKNAAEAMPNGGTVTLISRDNVNQNGQPHAEIVVADTGPGLPPEVMAHLFEPVPSTKGSEHAGLGLAIVKNLVKEIDASITCTSDKGGVTFQLLIPRVTGT